MDAFILLLLDQTNLHLNQKETKLLNQYYTLSFNQKPKLNDYVPGIINLV